MLSIFESDGLSDIEKEKLLSIYQEVADPVTLTVAGFGVAFTTLVALGVAAEIKVERAIKKYPKLYPGIPEFKTLEEKVFPMTAYRSLPNINDAVKHPKLYKGFHSKSYRVFYHEGKPMFIFAYGSSGWDEVAMFQPVSNLAVKHSDYYRICALRDSGLSDIYTMDFVKKVLGQEKPLQDIPEPRQFPQRRIQNTVTTHARMHHQNTMHQQNIMHQQNMMNNMTLMNGMMI